jgi:hypothetical protein
MLASITLEAERNHIRKALSAGEKFNRLLTHIIHEAVRGQLMDGDEAVGLA